MIARPRAAPMRFAMRTVGMVLAAYATMKVVPARPYCLSSMPVLSISPLGE